MKFELVPAQNSNPVFELVESKRIRVAGADFDEAFIAELISKHFAQQTGGARPTITTAFHIYMQECGGPKRQKFAVDAERYYGYFKAQFGDIYLDEIKHYHAALYRDAQLARGVYPTTVRKHMSFLNAMLNVTFRYLSIDRLSPFRSLKIPIPDQARKPMPTITTELTLAVKQRLLDLRKANAYVGLIQLNTGCRLSEPLFAKRADLILDHDIPHLWIKPNELTDRKTASSIRAIPLVGVSLQAARILNQHAKDERSEWLVPKYAKYKGNGSCSAIMNKNLKDLKWRSHMFRHAFIDRLKACGDIPIKIAESITGHSSGKSEFDSYGTVGYTLEQKLKIIQRVEL
ncbi:MAG: tyrosine-type recombinase/integrase [Magnetococcus sp. WYHC-3]